MAYTQPTSVKGTSNFLGEYNDPKLAQRNSSYQDNTAASELSASALGMPGAGSAVGGLGAAIDFDFKSQENLFSPGQSHLGGGAGFGLDTQTGNIASIIGDPLDLFGSRKKFKKAQQEFYARQAREKGVNALADKYNEQADMQRPYTDLGYKGLSDFGNYEQGSTFAPQLREGAQAIGGGQAASGMYNSSATGQGLSDFVNQLTNEDMNRQYQQNLNNVRIGQDATGRIGAAAQNFDKQSMGIYANEQNALAGINANYDAAKKDSFNSLSNIASGAASYYGGR